MIKSFDELIEEVKGNPVKKKLAVACANDEHTVEAVLNAEKEGICEPILIGDMPKMIEVLTALGETYPEEKMIDEPDMQKACTKAVELVREKQADVIMKGKVDTKIILKEVVKKEGGLGLGRVMSHFSMFELSTYHKPIVVVDGGMCPYPNVAQKADIIRNTVETLRKMGYEEPKVGVLACVEKVNPKMPETIEADELETINADGEIKNCIVEGPIQFDCAFSKEIADIKGLESKIAGDVDVLVGPNIHTSNILGKALVMAAGAKMAGFIVGAACPIVLVSRSSSTEEKFMSIVVSAAVNN